MAKDASYEGLSTQLSKTDKTIKCDPGKTFDKRYLLLKFFWAHHGNTSSLPLDDHVMLVHRFQHGKHAFEPGWDH